MPKRRPWYRERAEFALLQLLRLCFLVFPINMNLKTARLLGWVWSRVQRRRYQIAVEHLAAAYGHEWDQRRIHRIALRSMQNFVMTGIELIQSPRLISRITWPKYARLRNEQELIRLAVEHQAAILVTGHFGNFELLGQLLASFFGGFAAVMRGMDNQLINDYLVRTRSHTGLRLIFKRGAMGQVQQVLRSGNMLGFLADQNAGRKGLFVEFFGRPASTFKSIALLAIEHEVPVVVGYCRRIGDRFQHELGVQQIIYPQQWQAQRDPVRWLTQTYTHAIEAIVRQWPDQYLWTHRRWKTRPPEERKAPTTAPIR